MLSLLSQNSNVHFNSAGVVNYLLTKQMGFQCVARGRNGKVCY